MPSPYLFKKGCFLMDALTQAFYNVMYKYEKCFSERGVRANLDTWSRNKAGLLELLRRHPNWNEDELAVIFDLSERREIDHDIVDESQFLLNELATAAVADLAQRGRFSALLAAICGEYSQFPPDEKIAEFQQMGVKCANGQKASRIIGKLCRQYGVDQHPNYNTAFARLADALNPLSTQRTGILSIHPCDFLEMSNKDNSWSSCHGLDHGGYQAGCLSYLADEVSMIFFTVDEGITKDFHKHPKRTRQIFCYGSNVLLQSRLYPSGDDTVSTQYRGLVQKAISTCLGASNFWILKSKKNREQDIRYFETVSGSRQYPDYNYYGKVSLLKGAEEYGTLRIGHPSLCVCCGEPYTGGHLKCHCDDLVVCADCGQTVPVGNGHFHEGLFYCNACLHICAACGNSIHTDMYPAFNRRGHLVEVCASCYQQMTGACARCSVHGICGLLSGSRLCARTAITSAVA